jgi:hypothetical protein
VGTVDLQGGSSRRGRLVHDPFWDHIDVTRLQRDGGNRSGVAAKPDVVASFENQEALIGIIVHMPGTLTSDVGDLDIAVVHAGDHTRGVDVAERAECSAKVHGTFVDRHRLPALAVAARDTSPRARHGRYRGGLTSTDGTL